VALTQPSGQAEKKILKELEARALADGVAFGALLNQVRELEAGEVPDETRGERSAQVPRCGQCE
jgi:hypothetical protein